MGHKKYFIAEDLAVFVRVDGDEDVADKCLEVFVFKALLQLFYDIVISQVL